MKLTRRRNVGGGTGVRSLTDIFQLGIREREEINVRADRDDLAGTQREANRSWLGEAR